MRQCEGNARQRISRPVYASRSSVLRCVDSWGEQAASVHTVVHTSPVRGLSEGPDRTGGKAARVRREMHALPRGLAAGDAFPSEAGVRGRQRPGGEATARGPLGRPRPREARTPAPAGASKAVLCGSVPATSGEPWVRTAAAHGPEPLGGVDEQPINNPPAGPSCLRASPRRRALRAVGSDHRAWQPPAPERERRAAAQESAVGEQPRSHALLGRGVRRPRIHDLQALPPDQG